MMKTHKNCLKCYKIIQILTISVYICQQNFTNLWHTFGFYNNLFPFLKKSFNLFLGYYQGIICLNYICFMVQYLNINKTSQRYHTIKCSCHLTRSLYNKRPMGPITHLRKPVHSIKKLAQSYNYTIALVRKNKHNCLPFQNSIVLIH